VVSLIRRRLLATTLAAAAVVILWHRLVTPWHERWGATDAEARMALPGDDHVREPAQQVTRAITIDAEPAAVWPWLVQIGAERGGFYSYEWLENLFGLGIENVDVLVPRWQHRAVGDVVLADAKGSGGWCVVEVRPDEVLVLQLADVKTGRPLQRDEQFGWEFSWSFVLRPAPGARTRLLVRERSGFTNRVTKLAIAPIGVVSFVMTQKMLRGIKARAEARSRHTGEAPNGAESSEHIVTRGSE
jgi:hypothetical protein